MLSRRNLLKGGAAAFGASLLATSPLNAFAQTTNPSVMSPAAPVPNMKAVLDELAAFQAPPLPEVNARIARDLPTAADAVQSLLQKQGKPITPEPVGSVTYKLIPGDASVGAPEPILARVYTPKGPGPFPITVYFHGGGWVIANLNTYDSSARAICNAANTVVVSVAYRQSPETTYPGPVNDAYRATQWAFQNAQTLNGDAKRVAVAGESAGGNMAAVVCLMARDKGGSMPVHQLLVYPVAQLVSLDTSSYQTYANAQPLSKASAAWFFARFLANPNDAKNPYASPLLSPDFSKLPPATIIGAEIDPLQSEGMDYASQLKGASIPVTYQLFKGVTHEFFGMGAVLDEAKQAVALAGQGLRSAFGA